MRYKNGGVNSDSTDIFFNSFTHEFGSGFDSGRSDSEVEERYFPFPSSVIAISTFP